MQTSEAVRVAVDILQAPSRVAFVRASALPAGIADVLQIAAGDDEVIVRAARETGRSRERIVEAATFFIEQVMLVPEADSYRVLGGTDSTPAAELRRHMAFLMRWLHPDSTPRHDRSVFATRISRAWDDLKTDGRRSAYEAGREAARSAEVARPPGLGKRRRPRPGMKRVAARPTGERGGLLSRIFGFLFSSERRR